MSGRGKWSGVSNAVNVTRIGNNVLLKTKKPQNASSENENRVVKWSFIDFNQTSTLIFKHITLKLHDFNFEIT